MGGNVSYTSSELCALKNKFVEFQDSKAFNGRYFLKNHLIWIHNLNSLMNKLGLNEEDLKQKGYDVDSYHSRNC